ncbi:hypothetical protein NL676_028015 [Syzygium grande]|nr:hypothetical protein NL676_028015 [Syzygium grande]
MLAMNSLGWLAEPRSTLIWSGGYCNVAWICPTCGYTCAEPLTCLNNKQTLEKLDRATQGKDWSPPIY